MDNLECVVCDKPEHKCKCGRETENFFDDDREELDFSNPYDGGEDDDLEDYSGDEDELEEL